MKMYPVIVIGFGAVLAAVSAIGAALPVPVTVIAKAGDVVDGLDIVAVGTPLTSGSGKVSFPLIGYEFDDAERTFPEEQTWFDTGVIFDTRTAPNLPPLLSYASPLDAGDLGDWNAQNLTPLVGIMSNGTVGLTPLSPAPTFPQGTRVVIAGSPRRLPNGTEYSVAIVGSLNQGTGGGAAAVLYRRELGGNVTRVLMSGDLIEGREIIAPFFNEPIGSGYQYSDDDQQEALILTLDLGEAESSFPARQCLVINRQIALEQFESTGHQGEVYNDFRQVDINNSGDYLVSGTLGYFAAGLQTSFIGYNGDVVLRTGDSLDGITLPDRVGALSINDRGEAIHVWGGDDEDDDDQFGLRGEENTLVAGSVMYYAANAADLNSSIKLLQSGDLLDVDGDELGDYILLKILGSQISPTIDLAEDGYVYLTVLMTSARDPALGPGPLPILAVIRLGLPRQPQNNDDRIETGKKGAILFFPKLENRFDDLNNDGFTTRTELTQETFISLSNDGPEAVSVKGYYVNGDAPLTEPNVRMHPGWNFVDFTGRLTRENPAYWAISSGMPGFTAGSGGAVTPFRILDQDNGINPGRPDPLGNGDRVLRGFLVVYATNEAEQPVIWNRLSGLATIVNYANDSAYEYLPYAAQALGDPESPSVVSTTSGIIDLDGVTYDLPPDKLLFDFFADSQPANFPPHYNEALSGSGVTVAARTELTLMPLWLDFSGQGVLRPTAVVYNVWNENESRLSFDQPVCIVCWESRYIGDIMLQFRQEILGTNRGKARIDAADGVFCPIPGQPAGDTWGTVDTGLLGVTTKWLSFDPANVTFAPHAASTLVGQELEDPTSSKIGFSEPLGSGNLVPGTPETPRSLGAGDGVNAIGKRR